MSTPAATGPSTPLARLLRGLLEGSATLAIVALAGWPAVAALDGPFVAYLAVALASAGVAGLVADPVSRAKRDGADRRSETLLFLSSFVGLVLGAIDLGRWRASAIIPLGARELGVALLVLGYTLRLSSIAVNRFFSNLLVIQADRGHTVVDRGPYRAVRHPGYLGLVVILLGTGLAVGSVIGALAFAFGIGVVLDRTAREDRFLLAELPGYAAYAARVRARLVPGLW